MAAMTFTIRCSCLLMSFAGAASAGVVECTEEQRRALAPSAEEIREHRETALPAVGYPYGTQRTAWQFDLVVRVDAAGRVECYDEPPPRERPESQRGIEGPRRAIIEGLEEWRYTPFQREGRAVPVVITESLREYELPQRRRSIPDVSLDQVHISLDRSGCFGTCPDYHVEVFGDGRAVFRGNRFTAVRGLHRYSVEPAKVAALVERLRATDVWSARSVYRAPITDSPTYTLRIQLGTEVQEIEDYVGRWIGSPPSIQEFEDAVDDAAASDDFIHFATRAVDVLQREGFRFTSAEGARLLSRAVNDERSDDAALSRLVELGAPLEAPADPEEGWTSGSRESPLIAALENGHPKTVESLLARGVLGSNGRPSQAKIDAAFRAAIAGGDVALVKRIWGIEGETPHPATTFEDSTDGADESHPKIRKNADVITLIARRYGASAGDHREIAEFLVANGSDLHATRASGTTLLHSAAEAGDVEFVRFLLSRHLDPSATDKDGITPLGSTYCEEVSLLLLEAGSDVSKTGSEGYSFRKFAQSNGWYRVVAWLDSHGG